MAVTLQGVSCVDFRCPIAHQIASLEEDLKTGVALRDVLDTLSKGKFHVSVFRFEMTLVTAFIFDFVGF